jgi:hypothetical protein
MEKDGDVRRSIVNMTGTFDECVCLGYTSDRQINLNIPIARDTSNRVTYLDWSYGVPVEGKEGKRMFYTMEQSDDFWAMDGRPWSKPDSMSSEDWNYYYDTYFKYDEM